MVDNTGHFQHISTREGISHQNITSIYQDSRDFIWASTSDGLNRLNGKNILNFFHEPGNKNSLSANNCWMMSENAAGDLLLATESGLDAYRFSTNQFRKLLPNGSPFHTIFRDSRKNLWTGSGGQLMELDGNGRLIRNWTDKLAGNGIVQALREDPSGNIWVLRDYRLSILFPGSGKVENHLQNPRNLPYLNQRIRSFAFARKTGSKWMLTEAGELLKFDSNDELLLSFPSRPEWQLTRLFVSGEQQLWIGSLGKGLFCLKERENKFIRYSHEEDKPESISGNVINAMMEDRAGNIWIATTEGLNIMPGHVPDVRIIRDWGKEKYLKEMPVELTALYPSGLELLSASWGNGIYRRNIQTGKTKQISGGKSDMENMIWDLLPDPDGFWFGSYGGLFQYSASTNRIFSCKEWPGYPVRKDSVAAIRLFRDSRKQIWVSFLGNHGMMCLNPGTKHMQYFDQNTTPAFDLPHFDAAAETKDGKMYFGHQNRRGLVVFDPGTGKFSPLKGFQDFSNCLLADGDLLWIGSKNGLFLLGKSGELVRHFSRNEGLRNNQINTLMKDASGRIWAGSDGGIFSIEPDFSVHTLAHPDIEKESSIRRAYFEPATRKAWFVSDHSLISFFPDSIEMPAMNLQPALTRMQAGGLWLDISGKSDPFIIRNEINPLSFEYDAPCFFQQGVVRFSHRLKGLDTSWSAASPENKISFSHLPPGSYTFCLRATLDGKEWFYVPEKISFTVTVPFYRQTWFFVLLICIGFLVIFLAEMIFYRIQMSRIRYGQNIRNKISEDIHDDISLGLTRIIWQTETLLGKKEMETGIIRQTLQSILNSARETASRLSEIVWSVNSDHDNLPSFLSYLRHYTASVMSDLRMAYEIDFPENIPGQKMDAILVRNLILMAKESINNAIRHSGTEKIILSFYLQHGGKFELRITDEGKGFDTEHSGSAGNGLTNLKSRAEKIHASLSIQSAPGMGCSIKISGTFF